MTAPFSCRQGLGISGSEAHLLTLLPGLRERGWDARFCLLHEDEQGAGSLRLASSTPASPSRASGSSTCRPARLLAAAPSRAPHAAGDPAHASRPCGRLRPAGGEARAGPLAREHQARVQRLPRAAGVRGRGSRAGRVAGLHIAISAGLARTSPRRRGSAPGRSRSSTTGSPPGTSRRRLPASRDSSASAGSSRSRATTRS